MRKAVIVVLVLLWAIAMLKVYDKKFGKLNPFYKAPVTEPAIDSTLVTSTETVSVAPAPVAVVPVPPVVVPETPKVPTKKAKTPDASMVPPPVKIFPELIPKDINIVRVYYASTITGPNSSIEFDINGSGFNKEFEKMITVESGQPEAAVKNLSLITPNQIHGTLQISEKTATMVSFPRVLIQGKTVFQAAEPFATIRPGEVLNLVFTEMGESGRTGRFRIFTNLTPEMFSSFRVFVNTPTIQIGDLNPSFPFVVDGTIAIGPAVGGEYDINITLDGKNILEKKGIIRVVKPNVGQSGLIQKVITLDGFHRPGDKARFAIQGSGFQPNDINILVAQVPTFDKVRSSFTYVSPGRVEMVLLLPPDMPIGNYGLKLSAGPEVLQEVPMAFQIVEKNWTRVLNIEPALKAGGKSTLTLQGRDLEESFVSNLKVELDEPNLTIGKFTLRNQFEAVAPISAGTAVKPGDYLLHIAVDGKAVNPEYGSLIKVTP